MLIDKCLSTKLLVALYKDIIIFINKIIDEKCIEYIKFSFISYKPNSYLDVHFMKNDMPYYVQEIFDYIEYNNNISLSDDKLLYIFSGPSIENNKIFNIHKVFIYDYIKMQETYINFEYDYRTSISISEEILKPISFVLKNKK